MVLLSSSEKLVAIGGFKMMLDMMKEEIVVAGMPLQFPRPTAGNQLPTLAEWNQRYIEYVLSYTKGKKTAAARILGINRRTLYRRKKAKGSAVDTLNGQSTRADGHVLFDDSMPGSDASIQ
jgi:DNA-binding NtrC family response regulator